MLIEIQARDFEVTEALGAYVRRCINKRLSKRSSEIQRIYVWLFDINGPRGGKDKRCRVQVCLPQIQNVIIEDTRLNLYNAIDRAVVRAGRSVERRLSRLNRRNRRLFVPHRRLPALILNER